MNSPGEQRLEHRLRRLHAGLDAAPGFEARLAARIAALGAPAASPAQQRARADALRRECEAALRGRLWNTLGAALALALGAVLMAQLFGATLAQQLQVLLGSAYSPALSLGTCIAVVGAGAFLAYRSWSGPAPRLLPA